MTRPEVREYIYDWLRALNIGTVFQDRVPYEDSTAMKSIRSYVIYGFEDGFMDIGVAYSGVCTVIIGCRDKANFTADLKTLNSNIKVFMNEFSPLDRNDEDNGIHFIGVDEVSDVYSDGLDNHECRFMFDVLAMK